MLTINPALRITANDALSHPWLKKYNSTPSSGESSMNLIPSLRNLRNFGAEMLFQKAVLSYIAAQEINPEEEKKLKQLFDTLDSEKLGHVTPKALFDCYTKVYNDKAKARKASEQIIKRADFNNNGLIDYNGNVKAEVRIFNGNHGN
eukprot:TRINITY_DN9822_c0_g1_i2.p4 TRINITY_DN9822_c0_g1~~TRINITY_DN9822_c0_g1_i2.p4  ORF type:complete len:147 (-),score=26.49 TRINITY_DN9822_c0_g1_i2:301-741(-)